MQLKLTPHPDFPCGALDAIEASVTRTGPSSLAVSYRASGHIAGLVLAPPAAPRFTDGLWRTTCFEAFLKPPGGEGYVELNLGPSSQWASYGFTGYREGMAPLEIPTPRIEARRSDDKFELDVTLNLAGALATGPCRLALSAVIEETSGAKSYWALAHPDGRPDFHADAGFVAEMSYSPVRHGRA